MTSPRVLLVALLLGVAGKADVVFPADAFQVSSRQPPNSTRFGKEAIRKQILQALYQTNRDEVLSSLVENRLVAGERWFNLSGIEVRRGDLDHRANLSRICWDRSRFVDVDFARADLNGALLRGATFENVNLDDAILDNANLEDADFLSCSLMRVSALRTTCSVATKFRQCVMSGARFATAREMTGIEFSGGSLRDADFRQSKLRKARFVNIDLTNTRFGGADLTDAEFYNATLNGVDFTDSILVGGRLRAAVLVGNLRLIRTTLGATYFGDLDITKIDLTYVVWRDQNYSIGEELEADKLLKGARTRGSELRAVELYATAENIYRSLAQRYRLSGHLHEYLALRVRSLEARRKLLELENDGTWSWEARRLQLERAISNYDTSPGRFFSNVCITVLAFAVIFFLTLLVRMQWFVWYRLQPDGRDFLRNQAGDYVEAPPENGVSRGRFARIVRLGLTGLELSLEALFRFIENIIDIPNVFHLFLRKQDVRPLPRARGARILFGLEALMGLGFLYSGSRIVLLMIGSQ